MNLPVLEDRASFEVPLQERVAALPWQHRIQLPGGIVTPGAEPAFPECFRLPADLTGLRVLDVGANDGYWTFEALRRGAREVVAIDDFSLKHSFPDRAGPPARPWATFDLCREALGYPPGVCQRFQASVYEVIEDRFGRFDVIFLFGVFPYLRYPMMAIDGLAAVCNGEIYVESPILDDFSAHRGGIHRGYPGGDMVMEFFPKAEFQGNRNAWWMPTMHCLGYMLNAAGFLTVDGSKFDEDPQSPEKCRAFLRGSKRAEPGAGSK